MRHVTLVTGPPCCGKSTHVDRHASPDDLVVCFDQLAREAGSTHEHQHTAAHRRTAGARFDQLVAQVAEPSFTGRAWVIRCAPTSHERRALAELVHADTVLVLMPPMEQVLARGAAARRGRRIEGVIRRWYGIYSPAPGDTLIEASHPPSW